MNCPDSPRCRSPEHLSSPNRVSRLNSIKAHNSLSASLCTVITVIALKGKSYLTPNTRTYEKHEFDFVIMSPIMDQALKQPCMAYKPIFEQSEMEKVKLKNSVEVEGGRNAQRIVKEKKCPIFTGKEGIEGLLYVAQRYDKAARTIGWTTGPELYDNFEEVLTDTAEDHWENILTDVNDADKTPENFKDVALPAFYRHYCDDDARDTMITYLHALKRPVGEDPDEFSNRMQTLARYANKLPGIEPKLTDDQIKVIIFNSFPEDWRQAYIRADKSLNTEPLAKILQFMKNEKGFADKKDNRNLYKRKNKSGNDNNVKRIRGGGYYRGSNREYQNNNYQRNRNNRGGRFGGRTNRWNSGSYHQRNNNFHGSSYNNESSSRSNNYGRNNNGGRNYNNGGRNSYRGGRNNHNGGRGYGRYNNNNGYNQQQQHNNEQNNGHNQSYHYDHNRNVNQNAPAPTAPGPTMDCHHFDMIGNQTSNQNGSGSGSAWSNSNNEHWNS